MTPLLPARPEHREKARREGASWDGATEESAQDRTEVRTVVVVSADAGLRQRLGDQLTAINWRVREANGGAQAMLYLQAEPHEAMLVDNWLPDLMVGEFVELTGLMYPEMEVLAIDPRAPKRPLGEDGGEGRSRLGHARHGELLHAMRAAQDVALATLPVRSDDGPAVGHNGARARRLEAYRVRSDGSVTDGTVSPDAAVGTLKKGSEQSSRALEAGLPELVGESPPMRELKLLIRMVAPLSTMVLIEGETGTGKELVAHALHRLSGRGERPLTVLNCAAIPEALLEAELFGNPAGAARSRVGRIEAADGGTLLLDEIGEMPLGTQARMLRFLESGELQRVVDDEATRVNVRLIASSNQGLEQKAAEGTFRLDLYHRLAVFPIDVPALRERPEDIPELAEHLLEHMGRVGRLGQQKRLSVGAAERLCQHDWPGNVRELMHVLERGAILAGTKAEIAVEDIRYRRAQRS